MSCKKNGALVALQFSQERPGCSMCSSAWMNFQAGDLQQTGTLKLWAVTKICQKRLGVGLIENNHLEIKATLSEANASKRRTLGIRKQHQAWSSRRANLFQHDLIPINPLEGAE